MNIDPREVIRIHCQDGSSFDIEAGSLTVHTDCGIQGATGFIIMHEPWWSAISTADYDKGSAPVFGNLNQVTAFELKATGPALT